MVGIGSAAVHAGIYLCGSICISVSSGALSRTVFLGLTIWNFFGSTVEGCVGIINSYSAVTKKTYIPKFILVLMKRFENLIKMFISLGISIIAIFILHIPITYNILMCIPILFVYFVLTFGVGTICAYLGVFVSDLSHVISIGMRFLFYLSAVFYTLDRFGEGLLNIYNIVSDRLYYRSAS